MTTPLAAAVTAHVDLFNRSVRAGDFAAFVETFREDAVMRFVDAPAGPFVGRAAIAQAYAEQPPTDTMTVTAIDEVDHEAARARFAWDRGGGGAMLLRWRDGMVAELEVAFER